MVGNNKKYMIKVKLYILSVLLLLVSCTGNKVIDEQITRADSLMEANSDSALVALGMLDSLRKNNPKMSKAQQMHFVKLWNVKIDRCDMIEMTYLCKYFNLLIK